MEMPRPEASPSERPSIFVTHDPNGATSGGGEGMDRTVKKKKLTPVRIAILIGGLAFVALVGYGFYTTSGGARLNVERDKITVATVQQGVFQEAINVTGNVMPRTTVYLDAVEGGRVEEVFLREGSFVEAGQPLLRLSNSDLQLRLMSNEAALAEQESNLQTSRFQVEQNRLDLRQQLTEMDYQIQRLRRQHARNAELHAKNLIAEETFEETRDELAYWESRRELTHASYRQDSLSQAVRLSQMQGAVDRMRANFGLLQETLANLTVRAPVSGHLTALEAEIGELRPSGSRFGQIDVLDEGYRVRAQVDEFYISRIFRGQTATTQRIGDATYDMEIARVYPEVRDGRFEVDLDFVGEQPESFRRGQTVRLNLELSDPAEAVIIPQGGFFQETGGNWIYVVEPSGDFAVRRPIRIGRKNTQHYEVLEGLQPGEQVVTSSYQTFGDVDRLVFN